MLRGLVLMGIEKLEGAKQKFNGKTGVNWESKFYSTNVPRLSFVANCLLFELKKTTIKWRRRLALFAKKKFAHKAKRQSKRVKGSMYSCDNSLMLELGAELSSIFPRSAMFVSVRSAPSRLCLYNRRGLLDLDKDSLLRIIRQMDGQTIFCFARVCRGIRGVILANITSLPKMKSATYDMYIDFNKDIDREDVRVLKCGRSVGAISYSARSIRKLLPPMLCCQLRIHFGNNVHVSNWLSEIYYLYNENRLRPKIFIFNGGSISEAASRHRSTGADLQCFSEKDFIAAISLFVPHLKEVQLATSRLFRITNPPYFLFSMMELVSVFGMTYEPLPVYFDVDDICRIVCLWRYCSRSHSCEIYIRKPRGCDKMNWLRYGTIETDERNRVKAVRVKHDTLQEVALTVNFI
nr:Cyclin F-box domain containing protein [Haemonchus contortus]